MSYKIKTPGKLLFLLLSCLSLLILVSLSWLLWLMVAPWLGDIHCLVRYFSYWVLRFFYAIIFLGIVFLFFECYSRYSIRFLHEIIRFSIKTLFPVNIYIGRLFMIKKDRIRESFVQVNNSFIKANRGRYKPENILLLLPHCLQNYDCVHRVTNNIDVCHECGKCTIQRFKKLKKDMGVKVAIATGGTLARKIIVITKPQCIIAVACQRDLVDGLLDVFPIPVFGILNETPNGPCISTSVDMRIIEDFLNNFIIKNEGG
ncbi:MAG: DUF116 domain-containing protein [Candidatus Cloacimonetes bacterium]|nr:DUF116 domain-containing protein [Candidatus Cloacimonadota bacterium]